MNTFFQGISATFTGQPIVAPEQIGDLGNFQAIYEKATGAIQAVEGIVADLEDFTQNIELKDITDILLSRTNIPDDILQKIEWLI